MMATTKKIVCRACKDKGKMMVLASPVRTAFNHATLKPMVAVTYVPCLYCEKGRRKN